VCQERYAGAAGRLERRGSAVVAWNAARGVRSYGSARSCSGSIERRAVRRAAQDVLAAYGERRALRAVVHHRHDALGPEIDADGQHRRIEDITLEELDRTFPRPGLGS
jgi:hypothetical protein